MGQVLCLTVSQLSENIFLNNVLCIKQEQIIDSCNIFSFNNKHFQIVSNNEFLKIPKKSKIPVIINTTEGIKARYNGIVYDVVNFNDCY